MKALFKPVSAALLASFLAACSLIPPAQQSSQRQLQARQNLVQTAADTGQKPPEKVTFPSMVKTTPLDTNLPTDKNDQLNAALEQALAEKPAEEGFAVQSFNLPQVFIVRFMANTQNLTQQVKIPESGAFQLVLEAGSGKKLEILDGDGSDGQATIRLPKQTYETLLHLQGPWKPNSSLEVSDDLYYVKDTLSSKQGKLLDLNRWFLLGVRPLPVPSDWYNPDGQKLVLKFKTDTVKEFQMAWWTTNEKVAYPPGIKQIGPAGGTVELPGVAKLDLPAGALSAPTVVVMRQQKEVASRKQNCTNPNDPDDCAPGWVFAAPIVKIEPMGMMLNQIARLNLPIYNYFQKFSAPTIWDTSSMNVFNSLSWGYYPLLAKRPDVENFSDITHHNFPLWVQKFGFFSREIAYTSKEMDQFLNNENNITPPFQIQNQNSNCTPPQKSQFDDSSKYFFISDNHGVACPEALKNAKEYLEKAYIQYLELKLKKPPPYLDRGFKNPKIPVFLVNRFQNLLTTNLNVPSSANGVAYELYEETTYKGSAIQLNITQGTLGGLLKPDYWGQVRSETAMHELFHVFQQAYTNTPEDEINSALDGWLIEGTAALMGTVATELNSTELGLGKTVPVLYEYAERFDILNQLTESMYLKRIAGRARSPYLTVPFWTHLFNHYGGASIIADVVQEYGLNQKKQIKDTLRSTAALNAVLKQKNNSSQRDHLADYFIKFATDAIIHKNVSLFPDITLPHIGYHKTHIVKASHSVATPLSVSSSGTEPLSAVYLLLQADKNIREPRSLYVRAVSPDPKLSQTINGEFRKVREFLIPGMVGVNNLEGEAVKEVTESGLKRRKPYISSDFSTNKAGYLMMTSFGSTQPVRSAILSIFNTLWEYDTWLSQHKEMFTMNLEVFLGPKLLSAEWPKEKDGQDITTDKAAPQLDLTGTGFDPSKTEIIFQPRSEVGKEIKQKPVFLESKIDSDGVEIQNMFVNIPNQALKGGWIEARSANIPSNRIEQTTYACNMLPTNASFSTAAQKPCPQ